jgi:hypothetical protein
MNKRLTGTVLAAAVGAMFLSTPVFAQDSSANSTRANVKCIGGNACKGQSACKGASQTCKGQNGCKGRGFVMTSSAEDCTARRGHPEQPKN